MPKRSHVIFHAIICPKETLPPPPLLSSHPYSIFTKFALLFGEAESWRALRLVEDGVDGLQEDITEDVEADAGVGLETSEALAAAGRDWCVVDVRAWNDEGLAADLYVEVWQSGAAWEDVSTLGAAAGRTLNGAVVGLGGAGWNVKERSTSVSDGGAEAARGTVVATCGRAAGGELPEALGGVNWNVDDRASVLGGVDVAEGVATCGAMLEVCGEQGLGKGALHGVEEGGLCLGLDSVDAAESKAKKTVVGGVGHEGRGDRCCSFNSLRRGSYATDDNLVLEDIASRAGTVAVCDVPRVAL